MNGFFKKSKKLFVLLAITVVVVVIFITHQKKHDTETDRTRFTLLRSNDVEKYEKCDESFHPDSDSMSKSGYNVPVSSYDILDKFTVLTMVFNRFPSYREVLQHYICMPFVDRLVLLWANQEVDPPTRQSLMLNCSEKLFVHHLESAALTKRFANFPEIQTDAVFNVDDDKLVSAGDLQHGFNVWKKYPWGIVGYVPRGYTGTVPNVTYMADLVSSSYSLVLTSAAFLHREYLRMFEDKGTAEIKADIDMNKNCEDILMNFIVKEHCRCSGVFFVGRGRLRKPKNMPRATRLSGRLSHHQHRTVCLRKILNLYSKSVNFTTTKCLYHN